MKFGPSWVKANNLISAATMINPKRTEVTEVQVRNDTDKFCGLGQILAIVLELVVELGFSSDVELDMREEYTRMRTAW